MANNLRSKENIWSDNLELFENWQERYQFIMEQGRKLRGIPESDRKDSMLVRGCQSQVWMDINISSGVLAVRADSDALIVRGLIAIITDIYDQQPVQAVIAYDHKFAERLGLVDHLSPTRANGLFAMQQYIIETISQSNS